MTAPEVVAGSIARIQHMEALFDQLAQACNTLSPAALKTAAVEAAWQTLHDYYTNGDWMYDYELDEAGAIPKSLKRGVLSEDGLYNLLCDVADVLEQQ